MSEAAEPVLFDLKVFTRPAVLTENDIMERRVLLVVTFVEEASWFACTLLSGHYGDLLEWIVYKWSATMIHAFVSVPLGMPVANALLVHFLIHHGAKIEIYIPGRTVISINGARETSVQAIADMFSPRRGSICPKSARKPSLSLPCAASENVLIKRAIFSEYRYMTDTYLAQGCVTNKNIQTIKQAHNFHGNDVDGQNDTTCVQDVKLKKEHRQRSRTETRDMWEFYNYYPQVVSLLGIKQEHERDSGRRNIVVSSEYCLDDEDNRSCNDSGIDIPTSQIHFKAVQDACNHDTPIQSSLNSRINATRTASVRGQHWSVDEMIALSLLEAMELRNDNAQDDVGREARPDRTRRKNKSFRRAIAKFFRKYCAILRG